MTRTVADADVADAHEVHLDPVVEMLEGPCRGRLVADDLC